MYKLQNAADLIGRILIAAFFIPSGISKILGYTGILAYMAVGGVPGFVLPLVILTEIAGGTLILVGWHTRIVAFLVAGYTVLAVLIFHHHLSSHTEQIIAMAELAVAGGVLVLVGHGAGAWSLDARRKHRTPTSSVAKAAVQKET